MKLKLDESLGSRAQAVFVAAGHEVRTVWDQGLAGATDEELFIRCCQEERVLVALDLDFANPFRFDPSRSAGLAVLRVPDTPGGSHILRAASILSDALASYTITGHLWVVSSGGVREYRPYDDR